MSDEQQDPFESKFFQEEKKTSEKEIDLNLLFPDERNDLNKLFPEVETKDLLKRICKNKTDIKLMKQQFEKETDSIERET